MTQQEMVTVNVTQTDIDKARCGDAYSCAIARRIHIMRGEPAQRLDEVDKAAQSNKLSAIQKWWRESWVREKWTALIERVAVSDGITIKDEYGTSKWCAVPKWVVSWYGRFDVDRGSVEPISFDVPADVLYHGVDRATLVVRDDDWTGGDDTPTVTLDDIIPQREAQPEPTN